MLACIYTMLGRSVDQDKREGGLGSIPCQDRGRENIKVDYIIYMYNSADFPSHQLTGCLIDRLGDVTNGTLISKKRITNRC